MRKAVKAVLVILTVMLMVGAISHVHDISVHASYCDDNPNGLGTPEECSS